MAIPDNSHLPPPDPMAAVKEKRMHKSLRLPKSLWQRLDTLAKQTGATVTDLVEQAVRYYFAALDKESKRR